MSKPFTYWVRLALVVTLCSTLTVSPALAGKFVDRLLNRNCKPAEECSNPAPACAPTPACVPPNVSASVIPPGDTLSEQSPISDSKHESSTPDFTNRDHAKMEEPRSVATLEKFAPIADAPSAPVQTSVPPAVETTVSPLEDTIVVADAPWAVVDNATPSLEKPKTFTDVDTPSAENEALTTLETSTSAATEPTPFEKRVSTSADATETVLEKTVPAVETPAPPVETPAPAIEARNPVNEAAVPPAEKPADLVPTIASEAEVPITVIEKSTNPNNLPTTDAPAPKFEAPPAVEIPDTSSPLLDAPALVDDKHAATQPSTDNDPFHLEKKTDDPKAAEQPVTSQASIDDLFAVDSQPAQSPEIPNETKKPSVEDDIFSADSKTELQSTEPSRAEDPKSIDDIFGAETTPSKPAENTLPIEPTSTTPAPKAESLDDIFGRPAAESASETALPVDEKPNEAASPKETSIDEIFGNKPAATQAPTNTKELTKPKEAPAAPETVDGPSLDDLFGKPISKELKDVDVDKLFDSLFDPTAVPQPTEKTDLPPTTPAAPTEKDKGDELDKLFGIGNFVPPSEFKGAEFQTWVDNTGTYTVKARLVVIYSDRVKLIKENGKFTTVPINRLSEKDFQYVQWVASNLTLETNKKFVKKGNDSTTDNENVR